MIRLSVSHLIQDQHTHTHSRSRLRLLLAFPGFSKMTWSISSIFHLPFWAAWKTMLIIHTLNDSIDQRTRQRVKDPNRHTQQHRMREAKGKIGTICMSFNVIFFAIIGAWLLLTYFLPRADAIILWWIMDEMIVSTVWWMMLDALTSSLSRAAFSGGENDLTLRGRRAYTHSGKTHRERGKMSLSTCVTVSSWN